MTTDQLVRLLREGEVGEAIEIGTARDTGRQAMIAVVEVGVVGLEAVAEASEGIAHLTMEGRPAEK